MLHLKTLAYFYSLYFFRIVSPSYIHLDCALDDDGDESTGSIVLSFTLRQMPPRPRSFF